MSERAPVISIKTVTKRFGPVVAIDGVSVDLAEGEFFALLGPSGCGKTTLLRIIAGFETPDGGELLLDGKDIQRLRPRLRPINLMFQSYALFPHMSVRANIAYGLEMEGLAKAEIRRRVDEILDMTALGAFADRRPDKLSGGQRQRVALARALVKRPRVLLLDEPLGALDKKLREQMQLELKRMQEEIGITFVIVTHDQEEALVMADRIALMKDGRIEQLGTPRSLYEEPESRFVADFIGVTNLFEGTLADGGIGLDGHGVLPGRLAGHGAPGSPAAITLRPERVTLAATRPANGAPALEGRVAEIAYHGQSINAHVAVSGLAKPVLSRLSAADPAAATLKEGERVWCTWDPAFARVLTR